MCRGGNEVQPVQKVGQNRPSLGGVARLCKTQGRKVAELRGGPTDEESVKTRGPGVSVEPFREIIARGQLINGKGIRRGGGRNGPR